MLSHDGLLLTYSISEVDEPFKYRKFLDMTTPLEVDFAMTRKLKNIFFPKGHINLKLFSRMLFKYYQTSTTQTADSFIHTYLNLPFMSLCTGSSKIFKQSLTQFGYKPLYYPPGFDPLITALETNYVEMLNCFAEYFEENPNSVDNQTITEKVVCLGLGS